MSSNNPAHAYIIKSIVSNFDFKNVKFALLTSNLSLSTAEDEGGVLQVTTLKNTSAFDITIDSGDINCVLAAELSFAIDANDACAGSFNIADTKPVIQLTDAVLANYSSVMRCDDELKLELLAQAFYFNIEDNSIPVDLKLKQAIVAHFNDMLQEAIENEDDDSPIIFAVKSLTAEAIDSSSNALNKFLSTHQG